LLQQDVKTDQFVRVKRDKETGEFMDHKKDGDKFKGVGREAT
jgi:hypothetical protein